MYYSPSGAAARALLDAVFNQALPRRRLRGSLAIAVDNPAAIQIVWRQLDANPVTGDDPDPISPHTTCGIGDELVVVLQLHLEHRVRERLRHHSVQHDDLFLLDLSFRVALSSPAGSPGAASGR
jgi:hypothetical protein